MIAYPAGQRNAEGEVGGGGHRSRQKSVVDERNRPGHSGPPTENASRRAVLGAAWGFLTVDHRRSDRA